MTRASLAEFETRLRDFLEECAESPVVVTCRGRPVAVLIAAPEDEGELERLVLSHTPRFRQILEESEENIRRTGGIPNDEFWKMVEAETGKPAEESA